MPNVIERLSSIIRANINDLLDDAEDPEAMLNQIIRDMSDALRQADSDIADQIAQQKMIEGDLERAQKHATEWQQKAELAVTKGMDDLARQALARQNDYADQVDVYTKQLDAQTRADLEDLVRDIWHRLGVTVLFVTHDIDESVYLGERVIILSSSPTVVQEDVTIDLPDERTQLETRSTKQFTDLRLHNYLLIQLAKAGVVPAQIAAGVTAEEV